ncbi:MAG: Ig-like domain-containing protein, partial [Bacteroidales bacterium]|nr:Ig-like domain-containing protein [Bacteroidales bacterium]
MKHRFFLMAAVLLITTCKPERDNPLDEHYTGKKDEPSTVAVTSVSLNKTTLSLVAGSSETLVATVSPSDATNKAVNWTSSNSSVARVSSGGLVTAVTSG